LADEESRRVYASKLLFYVTMEKSLLDGIRSRYPIYLEETVHSLLPDEVVVDGGAYRGDTLQEFLDVSGGKFRTYYAFEPDPSNFSALKRLAVVDGERVVAVEAGLARQAGRLRFQPTGTEAAKLLAGEEAGEATARVVGLDDFFSGKPGPTFVKMDIEGGERDALQGAAKLIAGDAPKLAISAYHHAEDLWEVPALIQSLHSGYKLYCRHYTREIADTVCYAMPPR
jgi:FkbM family methyltransferase